MNARADVRLVRDGLAESREKARRLILDGRVSADGRPVVRPSEPIGDDRRLTIAGGGGEEPVGRGGLKLEKALAAFGVPVRDRVFADVGASTGGFTQCLLGHGARRVYAVDVGRGQLHERLRRDPRVCAMEGVNARNLSPGDFAERPGGAVVDVSFVSILKILPALYEILPDGGDLIALVKPQFEAGPGRAGQKDVVRNPAVHREVLENIVERTAGLGFEPVRLDFSPVRGQRGNIEFLLHARRGRPADRAPGEWASEISRLVELSHRALK